MSPQEYILCICGWINITCEIIWHLESSILSGEENIDVKPKINLKSCDGNVSVIEFGFDVNTFITK